MDAGLTSSALVHLPGAGGIMMNTFRSLPWGRSLEATCLGSFIWFQSRIRTLEAWVLESSLTGLCRSHVAGSGEQPRLWNESFQVLVGWAWKEGGSAGPAAVSNENSVLGAS